MYNIRVGENGFCLSFYIDLKEQLYYFKFDELKELLLKIESLLKGEFEVVNEK